MTPRYPAPAIRSWCAILNPHFLCDVCGLPGIKATANQKRHLGECAAEKKRQVSARLGKKRRAREHQTQGH